PTPPSIESGLTTVHVPILMYHYIGQVPPDDPDPQLREGLTVSPQVFGQQMDWLAANGYHPVTMAQVRGYFQGTNGLPLKPVALTFDDGHADFYTAAYPILQAHQFSATAFIISGFIDDANGDSMRSWQLIDISHHGIEIGAHTFNHLDLTTLSPSQLTMELVNPKAKLEQLTGQSVLDFAYPAGAYNATVIQAVQAAGYQSAVTTQPGTSHTWADRFTWTRQRVEGGESMSTFIANLGSSDPAAS
ncbi:MAG: polysaccharide deacetylase family protein, partial [Candidatus Dormibacteraceae bacterium]